MEVTLPGIVSELIGNLKSPLSEVTELAFERLVDTTIASNLCEDICGLETDINKVLATCIPPGVQPLEQFLKVTIILAISSPKNARYFVKLLQHFNCGTDSLIEKLLKELELYGQSSGPPDEVDLSSQVPPLNVSRESSVEQPPVLRLDIEATSSDAEGGPPEQTVRSPNDLERHTPVVGDSTELSLPSFRTGDEYEDPSWIAPERLETQPTPSRVFPPVGKVDYMPRGSDGPMCELTPLPKPALPSSQPTNEDNRARTKKRYRPATPHPGNRIHTPSPPPSPLIGKGKGGIELPWRDRTRSGKKVLPLSGPSLSSQPPRRKPRGKIRPVPRVPLAKSSPSTPKSSPSKPSLLKQAPKRQPSHSGGFPNITDKIELSYKEFAPHIPLEIGSSTEGKFNIFRVGRDKRAILTPKTIQELLREAEDITRGIWKSRILDDSTLRSWLGGDGKDLLDLPQVGSRIMDVESKIAEKIVINDESAVLLKFLQYCVLRVEDVATEGNATLRKKLGRYKQDVSMLYECLLGIFSRLGPVSYGRQLSLLNSLLKMSHKRLLEYLCATRRPIACDILLHTLNVFELPPVNNSNQVTTLLECVVYLLKSAKVGNDVVTKALAGASPERVHPKFSKQKLEYYRGVNICNEPPAKRRRLENIDSGYSSGPSDNSGRVTRSSSKLETHDAFSHKVELLAQQIEKSGPIVAKATRNQLFESCCDEKSIRKLKPDCPIDDHLIDTLPGLLSAAEDSVYLGTKFYLELLKTGYGNTRKWIQGIGQESGQWFFPAYEDSGRVVIIVNLYTGSFKIHDPQCSSYLAIKRREKVAKKTQAWLKNTIIGRNWDWERELVSDPQQEKDDRMYSGDYILNLLCLYTVGAEIPPDLDVMANRRRFLEVLSMAIHNNRAPS